MANHIPDSLVKYCDSATAVKILSKQALRWSAPHLFHDPLQLNYDSPLAFTQAELLTATVRRAVTLIFGADNPVGNTPMLQAIRRWRSEERFDDPDEAQQVLRGLLEQMVISRQEQIDLLQDHWRNYALRLRLCCFVSKPDNLQAWQAYGHNHRGVALRFRTSEGSSLVNPKKVVYQDQRPEITTLKEQLEAILKGQKELAKHEFASKFLYQPKAFSGLQEWRCMRMLSDKQAPASGTDGNHHTDVRFHGTELAAIYFGMSTPEAEKLKLTQLARAINPKIKTFSGQLNKHSYQLEFTQLESQSTAKASPASAANA